MQVHGREVLKCQVVTSACSQISHNGKI
uniref:Uncharacterized protein n=1 Tax=Arundo donax TaxID=35708 RepID=A0A0A9AR72_ARUDO